MTNQSIRQNAEDFVVYKKSIGYMYESLTWNVQKYVSFVEERDPDTSYPTKKVTDEFLNTMSDSPGTLYQTVCVLREFSRFLKSRGYSEAYIIPPKTASQPIPEPPYFFTQEEIDAFFEQLDAIKPHKSFKGREYVFPSLFRLLYCCGLRCKEARILECENVHLDELYIDIISSKGPKSRRIFISQELADYLGEYDQHISILFPDRKYFFPHGDSFYRSSAVSRNFRKFWMLAFPEFEMDTRPRAYDFRHHFAWANLNRWATEGLDVNVMLPYLMRYMGHQTVKETLYYFHFVPEFFPAYRDLASSLEDMIPEVPDEQ